MQLRELFAKGPHTAKPLPWVLAFMLLALAMVYAYEGLLSPSKEAPSTEDSAGLVRSVDGAVASKQTELGQLKPQAAPLVNDDRRPNAVETVKFKPISPRVHEFLSGEVPKLYNQSSSQPEQVRHRLRDFARDLSGEDAMSLQFVALDQEQDEPSRFYSVYLMSEARSPVMEQALLTVAVSTFSEQSAGMSYEHELILRLKALEGLTLFGTKEDIRRRLYIFLAKQNNSLLVGQGQGLLQSLDEP